MRIRYCRWLFPEKLLLPDQIETSHSGVCKLQIPGWIQPGIFSAPAVRGRRVRQSSGAWSFLQGRNPQPLLQAAGTQHSSVAAYASGNAASGQLKRMPGRLWLLQTASCFWGPAAFSGTFVRPAAMSSTGRLQILRSSAAQRTRGNHNAMPASFQGREGKKRDHLW